LSQGKAKNVIKVIGFVKANEKFSHDEYRRAHTGYHLSLGRRLRNIRGYIHNSWVNPQPLSLSPFALNEPESFDELWDGYGELYFDSYEDYKRSNKEGDYDRAGPTGLERDDTVGKLLTEDGRCLYGGVPFQFAVEEHVIVPVLRPEYSIAKILHFGHRNSTIDPVDFQDRLIQQYAPIYTQARNIFGFIVHLRLPDDVQSEFFADYWNKLANEPETMNLSKAFYSRWDVFTHTWFESLEDFRTFRIERDTELRAHEKELFDSCWFREIDETVGTLPRRDLASHRRLLHAFPSRVR
jgi:hypothetical protein